jgi:alkaline phosphatase
MNCMKKTCLSLLFLMTAATTLSGQRIYEVNKNAHSHNDYLQSNPFYNAYENRFASIEIDVYLVGSELYVAHDRKDIDTNKTIESLYINPLLKEIEKNGGKPYKGKGQLQFMIDLKTAGVPALKVLEAKLKPIRKYFDLKANPNAVRVVLSGSIPKPEQFKDFDEIFYFDGRPGINYTAEQLKRIAFFSSAMQTFSKWKGKERMPEADQTRIVNFVDSVHRLKKPVRFWGNPDTETCWQLFIKLGVDYLNTDSPAAMAKFLNTYSRKRQKP